MPELDIILVTPKRMFKELSVQLRYIIRIKEKKQNLGNFYLNRIYNKNGSKYLKKYRNQGLKVIIKKGYLLKKISYNKKILKYWIYKKENCRFIRYLKKKQEKEYKR